MQVLVRPLLLIHRGARQRSARTLALAALRDSASLSRGNRRHRGRFRFDSAPSIGTVACFNQARSARLAVAPRHVDDSPALPRLQELEKINVERAPNGGARDAVRHVVDYDIDPAIVDVLSLPHTARGHLDHLSSRDRADAFSARGVLLERALGQLRMKRSLHPRAVPIEPSLDVVARRALDRRFLAGCGFLGPDGIRLSASARRVYAFVAHSVEARPRSRDSITRNREKFENRPITSALTLVLLGGARDGVPPQPRAVHPTQAVRHPARFALAGKRGSRLAPGTRPLWTNSSALAQLGQHSAHVAQSRSPLAR